MGRYPPPIIHPPRGSLPVLLSVPHSGRNYDRQLLANAAQGRRALETLEDPLVDRLCWRAIAAASARWSQQVPRAAIDCNRGEDEVDPAAIAGISPAPVGPRARYGLGLVPSRTQRHGALWRRPIDRAELERRLAQVHRPYHEALAAALDCWHAGTAARCCSIAIRCRRGAARPKIVIGDRHGASAAAWIDAGGRAPLPRRRLQGRAQRSLCRRRDRRPPRPAGRRASTRCRSRSTVDLSRADGRTPGVGFDRVALVDRGDWRRRLGAGACSTARLPRGRRVKKGRPGSLGGRKSGRNALDVRAAGIR